MANRFFSSYSEYKITSPYGERTIKDKKGFHNGIDLVAKRFNGSSATDFIKAHTGGIVHSVGYDKSAGNYVYIKTDSDVLMAYFHLKDNTTTVKKGETVVQGQIIGYMGNTGNSFGAHLHWGIKDNGKWVNPTDYLDKDYPKKEAKKVLIEMDVLKKGFKGEQVKTLQRLLVAFGYDIGKSGIDGSFGKATDNAVRKYQADKKLTVDGSVGKNTWNSLLK